MKRAMAKTLLGIIASTLAISLISCNESTPKRPVTTANPPIATTEATETTGAEVPETPAASPPAETPAEPTLTAKVLWQQYTGTVGEENVVADSKAVTKYYFCRYVDPDGGSGRYLGSFLGAETLCQSVVEGVAKTSDKFSLLAIKQDSFDSVFTWKTPVSNKPADTSFSAGVNADGTKIYPCRVLMNNQWRVGSYDLALPDSGCQVVSGGAITPSTSFQFAQIKDSATFEQAEMIVLARNHYIGATKDTTVSSCSLENGITPVENPQIAAKYEFSLTTKSKVFLGVTGLCGHAATIDFNVINAVSLVEVDKGEVAAGTSDKMFEFELEASDYVISVLPAGNVADYFALKGLVLYGILP